MDDHDGATRSLWHERSSGRTQRPALAGDDSADVCVVGAGIAGLTTAYLLAREGKRVVVLEREQVGSGETGRTTAHLSDEIDDRYVEVERVHGAEGARLARESHRAAIDRVEGVIADERLSCGFVRVDGFLFRAPDQPRELLDREYGAARRAGAQVDRIDRAPLDGFDTGPCLRFGGQAQFYPLEYLDGLAAAVERMRGVVYERTQANEVAAKRVVTERGAVTADAVVVATNTPMHQRVGVHPKQAAYRTYAVALDVPSGAVVRALYWDTADPYHYVRLMRSHENGADVLIVGGEDHRTGQDLESPFARLEAWARVRFPAATSVAARWSGQVMETPDGLAYIGRSADGTYIATGDSGMGMTHGTIAGMILSDLLVGRENRWAKLYDPHRLSIAAGGELVRENLNTAARYADWIRAGDVSSLGEIRLGEGAVIRRGLHKVAAYRDEQGDLHLLSAVCPHLGCIVAWNPVERSWDCPCHGSRFDRHGRVLNGPANRDLASAEGGE